MSSSIDACDERGLYTRKVGIFCRDCRNYMSGLEYATELFGGLTIAVSRTDCDSCGERLQVVETQVY